MCGVAPTVACARASRVRSRTRVSRSPDSTRLATANSAAAHSPGVRVAQEPHLLAQRPVISRAESTRKARRHALYALLLAWHSGARRIRTARARIRGCEVRRHRAGAREERGRGSGHPEVPEWARHRASAVRTTL